MTSTAVTGPAEPNRGFGRHACRDRRAELDLAPLTYLFGDQLCVGLAERGLDMTPALRSVVMSGRDRPFFVIHVREDVNDNQPAARLRRA